MGKLVLKFYTCLRLKTFNKGEAFKLSFFSGDGRRKLLTESALTSKGTVNMSHLERLNTSPDGIELAKNCFGEKRDKWN